MRRNIITLIARQFIKNIFSTRVIYGILVVLVAAIAFAAYSGWKAYRFQNETREHYQRLVRERWEDNPDKHPHRMAHFGSFAFRLKHPLSVFDFGLESFMGNAVYLEAHKQNTVNFSEASFSTGLLRFGEISLAMILQIVLPLVIVFVGFSAVSADRENGTLKVIVTQGASFAEILFGKALGLFAFALLIAIPVFVALWMFLLLSGTSDFDLVMRLLLTVLCYLAFIATICFVVIAVSATSASSKSALLKLLGIWLLLAVILPRTTQALGSYFYPAPSKIEFETAIEEDVLKEGDSHNPDDPHYKHLKDSVLRVHQVDSVEKLPFNYSGFIMREGEKISATIYNKHLQRLQQIYERQNRISHLSAFVNPFSAIRNLSMALSATDFESYRVFQDQSEAYRYQMAQKMNELQMEFISNRKPGPGEKPLQISREHWKELPDFSPKPIRLHESMNSKMGSLLALVCWLVISIIIINRIAKTANTI